MVFDILSLNFAFFWWDFGSSVLGLISRVWFRENEIWGCIVLFIGWENFGSLGIKGDCNPVED